MTELWELPASDAIQNVQQGKASVQEMVESSLKRLDDANSKTNAVVIACHEDAMERARQFDAQIAAGKNPGPLAGVTVTVKVNIDQKGFANTNGLRLQENKVVDTNHPVVDNLQRAGAVIIGRTNTPAFSMRWFTRNSLHGATVNPLNPALTPGGSSGGAASAVASGIGSIAHGTDIAGSIRYPAYACGVHGLRPSMGRIPAWNASAPDRYIGGQMMAVSGPLARTIDDLELGFHAMAAEDVRDPWWVPVPLQQPMPEKKAALCVNPEGWQVDPDVEKSVRQSAAQLQDAGWEVTEVECPSFRDAGRLNMVLWIAEMRRAGESVIASEDDPDANFVYEQLKRNTTVPDADGLLDVMQERISLTRKWQEFMQQYPLLICPVSSELPFEDHSDVKSAEDFDRIYEAQLIQIGLPVTGLPGMAVTTGMVGASPVGVQLIAGRFREDVLFSAGKVLEKANGSVPIANPT